WTALDRVVSEARAQNLAVLPILTYIPAWARPRGCSSEKCGPANAADFAAFAQAAAQRFAPAGVHTWEIWNEPNIPAFWRPRPDPSAYSRLLKGAANAVHQADPVATVVSAGLAPAATSGGEISPVDFLTGMCRNNVLPSIDAVGFHPYSYPVPPSYNAP